ncbi:MAG: voltage-gated potassium channel protein [Leptospirales bacterium]
MKKKHDSILKRMVNRVEERRLRLRGDLERRFHLRRWFPQVPLAVAMALFGLRNAFPLLSQIQLIQQKILHRGPVEDFQHLPRLFHFLGGIPHTVLGVVEILMSLGLLFRSRFAWTVCLVLSIASLAILLQPGPDRFSLATVFDLGLLGVLLLYRGSFSRSSLATGTLFSLVSIVLLFGYAIFGSYMLGKGFKPPIMTLETAFYFSVVTMTTVGYGDIVPTTDDAKLFVVSMIILGITIFTASISTVLIPIMNERIHRLILGEKKRMPRKNHFILIGTGGLALNAYQELKNRDLPVTLIVNRKEMGTPWDGADQVEGDPADPQTLGEAGAMEAQAVLSLLDNDSENAFVVLAVREMKSPAKTVVSVRDRVNLSRIRTVRPDMVLSPDVIGGELLAMALTGEKIEGDDFLKRIFRTGQIGS